MGAKFQKEGNWWLRPTLSLPLDCCRCIRIVYDCWDVAGGEFFVDRCLPMGCAISCSYFELFSSFLEWVVKDLSGIGSILHYLDDFLVLGPPNDRTCAILLATMQHVFHVFGDSTLIRNLMLLELFPIVLAVELWGKEFRDRRVRFHCDNLGVVHAIDSLLATSLPVVRLLRHLVLRCLLLNIVVCAVHILGVENCMADAFSRLQWDRFRQLAPEEEQIEVQCPSCLWDLVLAL